MPATPDPLSAVVSLAGVRHYGTGATERAVTAWRVRGVVIPDGAAAAVASWWAAPGYVGRHLAALSTGAPVSLADVRADVAATWPEATGPDDRDALAALDAWAVARAVGSFPFRLDPPDPDPLVSPNPW